MDFVLPGNPEKTRINPVWVAPITLLFVVFAAVELLPAGASGRVVELPFDAGNFPLSPVINNRYFPLPVNTIFVYRAQTAEECSFDKVTITQNTRTVLGWKLGWCGTRHGSQKSTMTAHVIWRRQR